MKKVRLFSLFALLALGIALPARAQDSDKKTPAASGFKDIGVEEFAKLATDKKNVVLDVRTPEEFAAAHIAGAINLDVNSPDFEKKVAALDKEKVYLVHCAAGRRSARACEEMTKLNFSKLYNLTPGFKGWQKAGKPVEKKSPAK